MDLHYLPYETLLQIAGYLAGSHRPSLCAFGLASKFCHSAAAMFIFRHIHLAIHNPKDLQLEVNTLLKTLSRTNSFRHVSTLSLKGYLDIGKPVKKMGRLKDIHPLGWWKKTLLDEPRINTLLPNTEPIPRGWEAEYLLEDRTFIEPSSEEDTAWIPVVDLIKELKSLSNLVYDCPNRFPPYLLEAIHNHPRCKLHHLKFRLQTLSWDTPDPYEIALATSPRLYSVKLYCTWLDSEGNDDFSQEATMELVAGLAPNLQEVTVVKFTPPRSNRYSGRGGQWKGLPGFNSNGRMVGSLTSLSLLGTVCLLTPALLQTWSRFTDFSFLRSVSLGGEGAGYHFNHVNGVNGEVMAWMAYNCHFARLKVLRLVLERDTNVAWRPNYSDNAVKFFLALNPLNELLVTGPLEPKILEAILDQHGQTLEKLGLHPIEDASGDDTEESIRDEIPMIFSKENIQQIHLQCPVLKELAIPIKRSQTDTFEVEKYKSLARFKHLHSLFLILDCSDWRVTRDTNYSSDPAFDENDHKIWSYNIIKQGHLRVSLINSAVDEKLARSIWGIICQHKAGRQLESLKLWTTGGGIFGNDRQEGISLFTNLSRSWSVTRVPGEDKNIINVTELGKLARETNEKEYVEEERRWKKAKMATNTANNERARIATVEEKRTDIKNSKPLAELTESELDATELDTEAMRIFRRIWPRRDNSKGWRNEWSSFPLQG